MYQVLARKYRPRNFNELVGQTHVSRALTSALERGRLHHAYLFTGTRGVGKTTIARILAKCLNCETGVTSTPCETCATCKAVNEGRFIDLIEIDAASRTKVEDTRELLDNVPYAPTQGRFKVYLIDEVHMLSTHSFNALLKTLEEPPEHVKFLFATTDPQKLPITVISRCLQFTLRPLVVDEITHHLTEILNKEQIQSDADAIWQIAESAQGSLRDALSLTDQAIAYGQGAIQHQDVKEMLGLIDRHLIYDLLLAIHQNDQAAVSQLLLQFRQQALDVSLVLDQLISTLHDLALMQYLPNLALSYSDEIKRKIHALAGLMQAQDIQLYYQIACKGRADLQLAVTQTQGFEMCVLRLLAFRPLQPHEVLVQATPVAQVQQASLAPTSALLAETTLAETTAQVQLESRVDQANVDHIKVEQIGESQAQQEQLTQTEIASDSDEYQFDFPVEADTSSATQTEPVVQENASRADDNLNEHIATPDAFDLDAFPVEDDGFDAGAASPQNAEEQASIEAMHRAVAEAYMAELQSKAPADEPIDDLWASPAPITQPSEAEDASIQPVSDFESQPVVEAAAQQVEHSLPAAEPTVVAEPVVEQIVEASDPVLQAKATDHTALMPLDILYLPEQDLTGEWTLEKWEYWFRQADISPAMQGIAQQGIMRGQINGLSELVIPPEYQAMLEQLQSSLQEALVQQWPNTQFTVVYEAVNRATPFHAQTVRKQKAHQRAEELLREHPVIGDLIQSFEGELQNVELHLDAERSK